MPFSLLGLHLLALCFFFGGMDPKSCWWIFQDFLKAMTSTEASSFQVLVECCRYQHSTLRTAHVKSKHTNQVDFFNMSNHQTEQAGLESSKKFSTGHCMSPSFSFQKYAKSSKQVGENQAATYRITSFEFKGSRLSSGFLHYHQGTSTDDAEKTVISYSIYNYQPPKLINGLSHDLV